MHGSTRQPIGLRSFRIAAAVRAGILAGGVLVAGVLSPHAVGAAELYWSVASGDWFSPDNWGGTLPGPGDYAWVANGGTATISGSAVTCTGVYLGKAGTGTVLMTGGTLAGDCFVGDWTAGTFLQSGGTNGAPYYILNVGGTPTASGTYCLSATAQLVMLMELIGDSCTGSFTQSGGRNTVYDGLYLGYASDGSGSYTLSGSGQLSAPYQYVGYEGTGSFIQLGGANVAGSLVIGTHGSYLRAGGTLELSGFRSQGVFDGGGGTGVVIAGTAAIVDLTSGTIVNCNSASVSLGANSIAIVAPGFQPADYFHTFSNSGITHTLGTPLAIAAGEQFGGCGSISDPLKCQGTLMAASGGLINLSGGVTLSGSAAVGMGGGILTTDGTASTMSGGSLWGSVQQYVGVSGSGSFTQSGGSNACDGELYLGYNSGAAGSYCLSGTGQLYSGFEYVGGSGIGTFLQTGGVNTLGADLYVGSDLGGRGYYNLGGTGRLFTANQYLGGAGTGIFTQTGGINSASAVYIGPDAYGSGGYWLGGGTLLVKQVLGGAGSSTLVFDGGVLQADAGAAEDFLSGLTQVYVEAGGAHVDTNGQNITIAANLCGSGDDGGLSKSGGGTLTLSGSNTYSGGITVLGGVLHIESVMALPAGSTLAIANTAEVVFATDLGSAIQLSLMLPGAGGGEPGLTYFHVTSSAPASVPEPGTLALLAAAALTGLAACRRRRSRT
jgi:fibronectin-binding autotransporter adhesin